MLGRGPLAYGPLASLGPYQAAGGIVAATLADATLAANGTVLVQSTLSVTLGALTGTLTGKVTVRGTAAGTLLPLTIVGTGTVANQVFSGTLGSTLGALTMTSVVDLIASGTAANTLSPLTALGTGTVANQVFRGTLGSTLGALTGTLTGKVTVRGTAAGTLLPLTIVGTGTVVNKVYSGTLSATLVPLRLFATQQYGVAQRITEDDIPRLTEDGLDVRVTEALLGGGILDATFGDLTATLTGRVRVGGTAAGTLLPLVVVGTGTAVNQVYTGTLGATLGALTISASHGDVLVKGALAQTLGALTGTLTGKVAVRGTAAGTLLPMTVVGTGTVASPPRTGTLNVTLDDLELFATSTVIYKRITEDDITRITEAGVVRVTESLFTLAALDATLGALTGTLSGKVRVGGTAAGTLLPLVVVGTGTAVNQVYTGTFNRSLNALTGTLSGKVRVGGTAAGTLLPLMLVSTGTVVNYVFSGTLGTTLGALTALGIGTVTSPTRIGTLSATLDDLELQAFSALPPQRITENSLFTRITEIGDVRVIQNFFSVGSVNATLGALTGTLTGRVRVGGTAAGTLLPMTVVGTGTVRQTTRTGTLTATLEDVELFGTSTVIYKRITENSITRISEIGDIRVTEALFTLGQFDATLSALTGTLTGRVRVGGTAAGTLLPLVVVGSGTVKNQIFSGTLGTTLGALTGTLTGRVAVRGTAAGTLLPMTVVGSGTITTLSRTATLNVTLDDIELFATESLVQKRITEDGITRLTEDSLDVRIIETIIAFGTLDATLGNLTGTLSGKVTVDGTAAGTLLPLVVVGSGTVTSPPRIASLTVALAPLTLEAFGTLPPQRITEDGLFTRIAEDGVGIRIIEQFISVGTFGRTLGTLTGTLSGRVRIGGTAAGTLLPMVVVGSGTVTQTTRTGTLSATLGPLTLLSPVGGYARRITEDSITRSTEDDDIRITEQSFVGGQLGVTLGALTGTLSGKVKVGGTAAGTLLPLMLVGTGTVTQTTRTGTLTATLEPLELFATESLIRKRITEDDRTRLTEDDSIRVIEKIIETRGGTLDVTLDDLVLQAFSALPPHRITEDSLFTRITEDGSIRIVENFISVGTLGRTLSALTGTLSGKVRVGGTAAGTLLPLMLVSSGTVTHTTRTGSLDATLDDLELFATDSVLAKRITEDDITRITELGDIRVTETAITFAALSTTLGDLTGTLSGRVSVEGTAAGTLLPLMLVGNGTVTTPPRTGSLTATLDPLELFVTDAVVAKRITEDDITRITELGDIRVTETAITLATLGATLGALTGTLSGKVTVGGTAAGTLLPLMVVGNGTVTTPSRTGTLNVTLDALTLQASFLPPHRITEDGITRITEDGVIRIVENFISVGTFGATLGALTGTLSGRVRVGGTAAGTLLPMMLVGTGTVKQTTRTGSLDATLGALTLRASFLSPYRITENDITRITEDGVIRIVENFISVGTFGATLGELTGTLSGRVRVGGTAAGTLLPMMLVGTGTIATLPRFATLDVTLEPLSLLATEFSVTKVRETEDDNARITEGGLIRMIEGIAGTRTGVLDVTLEDLTGILRGTPQTKGVLGVTLGALTGTLTGKVTVGGSAAGTLLPLVLVGTGTVKNQVFTGTLNASLDPLHLFASNVPYKARVRIWNGSSWVYKLAKIWNGNEWQVKRVKYWNDDTWA